MGSQIARCARFAGRGGPLPADPSRRTTRAGPGSGSARGDSGGHSPPPLIRSASDPIGLPAMWLILPALRLSLAASLRPLLPLAGEGRDEGPALVRLRRRAHLRSP